MKTKTSHLRRKKWWLTTTSNIVGTVIGIIITFGTGILVERKNREKDRTIATMMIAENIFDVTHDFEEFYKNVIEHEPLLWRIVQATPEEIAAMPDDSLAILATGFEYHSIQRNEFARHLLNSNFDILRSVDDYWYIVAADQIYSMIDRMEEEMEASGPKAMMDKINAILREKAIEDGVLDNSLRWNLMTVCSSPEIRYYISEFLSDFMQKAHNNLEITRIIVESVYKSGRFTHDEYKKFFKLYEDAE